MSLTLIPVLKRTGALFDSSGDLTIIPACKGQNHARLVKIQCGARQSLIEVERNRPIFIAYRPIDRLTILRPLLVYFVADSADQGVGDGCSVICLIKFGGGQELIAVQLEAAVLVYRNPIPVVL